ncbi:hypothetical protein [Romboutsia sp.]|uniref:hypothetical protein n=1 Tax=Romboutsia sp. TaxID=1965302 RepID=UPI002CA80A20|nr:hypothetical protein [Romboutsia sp.]HSQ90181.1 hypothetical protein [Romboutsia sp.]
MGICYMTQEGSYIINGWNLDKNKNLWVSRTIGGNKKIASGDEAKAIHDEFCRIAESQMPCLMHHNGMFITNVESNQEGAEEEVEG